MAIHLCGPPGDIGRATRPTFGLAPGGVYRADRVTPAAGALLPHRFTLACARRAVPSAVCSLWHCPAGHPDWPLASTLPCGAPTFLSRLRRRNTAPAATTRPARHHRAHSLTCLQCRVVVVLATPPEPAPVEGECMDIENLSAILSREVIRLKKELQTR